MCNIHTKELNNKENTAKIRNNLRSYLHLTKTRTKRNMYRERERKKENFRKGYRKLRSLTRILPDETMYRWHGNPYKRGHGLADIFPTSCVSLEPSSSQPIDHLVNVVTRLLDTRYSSFIAANDDRTGREEEGGGGRCWKGGSVFVALSSRPHTASPVDTQLCVATRHDTKGVGGRSPQLARRQTSRRFFRGNKGYQAFIIRQRRVGRASGWSMTPWRTSERGSGSGNRFGNLFAPSHSVQLLSLVGIRNCVKLNSRFFGYFVF